MAELFAEALDRHSRGVTDCHKDSLKMVTQVALSYRRQPDVCRDIVRLLCRRIESAEGKVKIGLMFLADWLVRNGSESYQPLLAEVATSLYSGAYISADSAGRAQLNKVRKSWLQAFKGSVSSELEAFAEEAEQQQQQPAANPPSSFLGLDVDTDIIMQFALNKQQQQQRQQQQEQSVKPEVPDSRRPRQLTQAEAAQLDFGAGFPTSRSVKEQVLAVVHGATEQATRVFVPPPVPRLAEQKPEAAAAAVVAPEPLIVNRDVDMRQLPMASSKAQRRFSSSSSSSGSSSDSERADGGSSAPKRPRVEQLVPIVEQQSKQQQLLQGSKQDVDMRRLQPPPRIQQQQQRALDSAGSKLAPAAAPAAAAPASAATSAAVAAAAASGPRMAEETDEEPWPIEVRSFPNFPQVGVDPRLLRKTHETKTYIPDPKVCCRPMLIDGRYRPLFIHRLQPCVEINGMLRAVRYVGPPVTLVIDGERFLVPTVGFRSLYICGKAKPYNVCLGGPLHELIVNCKAFHVPFNGPPVYVDFGKGDQAICPQVQLLGAEPPISVRGAVPDQLFLWADAGRFGVIKSTSLTLRNPLAHGQHPRHIRWTYEEYDKRLKPLIEERLQKIEKKNRELGFEPAPKPAPLPPRPRPRPVPVPVPAPVPVAGPEAISNLFEKLVETGLITDVPEANGAVAAEAEAESQDKKQQQQEDEDEEEEEEEPATPAKEPWQRDFDDYDIMRWRAANPFVLADLHNGAQCRVCSVRFSSGSLHFSECQAAGSSCSSLYRRCRSWLPAADQFCNQQVQQVQQVQWQRQQLNF